MYTTHNLKPQACGFYDIIISKTQLHMLLVKHKPREEALGLIDFLGCILRAFFSYFLDFSIKSKKGKKKGESRCQ